jgi:hypothetical protein
MNELEGRKLGAETKHYGPTPRGAEGRSLSWGVDIDI